MNVPNRGNRGLLGLDAAEKAEVDRRVAAERAALEAANPRPRPVEFRPMRFWPESGHYTKARG